MMSLEVNILTKYSVIGYRRFRLSADDTTLKKLDLKKAVMPKRRCRYLTICSAYNHLLNIFLLQGAMQ